MTNIETKFRRLNRFQRLIVGGLILYFWYKTNIPLLIRFSLISSICTFAILFLSPVEPITVLNCFFGGIGVSAFLFTITGHG